MKGSCKNRIFIKTLLLSMSILFFACNGYGGDKHSPEAKGVRIKGGEEVLVARNITTDRPFWCGRDSLIYNLLGRGIHRHNIETGRDAEVAGPGNIPLACTPDGQWLVYIDKDSLRHDEGPVEREVVDVWRYEFKSKKRHRFAVADYDEVSSIGDGVMAPTGKMVFLGKQPKAMVKMPTPEWDILWTQKQAGLTAWFYDSEAIVRVHSGEEKDRLLIEVLRPERESVFLEQKAKHILHVLTARENVVYMQVSNEEFEPELINEVIKCSVNLKAKKSERLSCIPVLEDYSVKNYDVFSNGAGFVFMEWKVAGCVRIARKENGEEPCITRASYYPGFFLNISPDDRWVGFVAFRKKENDTFANDLYVVKLKD